MLALLSNFYGVQLKLLNNKKPAATALTMDFALSDADVDDAVAALDRDGRFVRTFRTEALDQNGQVCALIKNEVYLRRTPPEQSGHSAF